MRSGRPVIDAHSHFLPEEIRCCASFYSDVWGKIETHLEAMERWGIDKSILLYPTTDVSYKGVMTPLQEARLFNDAVGKIAQRYPGTFCWAALPTFLEGVNKEELKRAREEGGACGLSLASSYDGVYLDDERFFPLYEVALEFGWPVFVHATTVRPIGSERVEDPLLTPVIEFTFDLAMCVGKLLMSEVFKTFPQVIFIFSHFAGVVPFLKERFDTTYTMLRRIGYVKELSRLPSDYLKHLYVDMSGCSSPSVLECALELFGSGHILWGSDYPASMKIAESLANVETLAISEGDKDAILGGNSERIIGR